MKKSELKNLIREEYQKLNEDESKILKRLIYYINTGNDVWTSIDKISKELNTNWRNVMKTYDKNRGNENFKRHEIGYKPKHLK
jgi:hypothetical protein